MNKSLLYCDACSYKQIIEEVAVEVPRTKLQSGIPYIDPVSKTVKQKPLKDRKKMVKCPKCGRGVVLRRLPDSLKPKEKDGEN